MKKIIIIALAVIFTVPAFAQNAKDFNKNQFLLSLTEFTITTFKVSYVRDLENSSIDFNIGIKYQEGSPYSFYENHEETINAELKYRINVYNYYEEDARLTLYFAPYVQYKKYNITSYFYDNLTGLYDPIYDNGNAYGGGVIGGVSWIIARRLVINAYIGGGFRYADNVNNIELDSPFDAPFKGIAPKAGIDLGFTF